MGTLIYISIFLWAIREGGWEYNRIQEARFQLLKKDDRDRTTWEGYQAGVRVMVNDGPYIRRVTMHDDPYARRMVEKLVQKRKLRDLREEMMENIGGMLDSD